jgi:hypothetical protein
MFYKILRGRPSSHRWAIALVSLPKEAEYDVWPLKVRASAIHINHIFEVTAKDNKFAFVPVNEFEHANTFSLDATPTTFVVGKDFVVQNFENKHLLTGNGYYFLQTPDNLQKFYNMISGSNDDHCIIKAFLNDKGVKNAMCQCK